MLGGGRQPTAVSTRRLSVAVDTGGSAVRARYWRAMSQARPEDTARQIVDGISSRDLRAIEAACDPEVEFTSRFAAVEGKTYRGHAGWADYLADLEDAWEDFRITIEELIPVGPERLVIVLRVKALARGSHVPIDQRVYAPWEFRRDKALRGRTRPGRAEALEAVGLSE
jgi:ketosteroid isomerase-like protein